MFGDDLSHPSDIKMSEMDENMGKKDFIFVPPIDALKSKLLDIFIMQDSDEISANGNTPGIKENSYRLVTLEDGTVINLPVARSCKNITETDDNGTVYLVDGELEADTTYELNGNTYKTDEQGRIVHCEARPERSPENPRDVNAQLQTGGEDRQPSDQGGHIVGRDLNGNGGAGNLVAMDAKINQSDYKRMEKDMKDALDEGKDVSLVTDLSYPDDSKRPDRMDATITADGVKTVYKFDNNLDGRLKDEVPETGKEVVNEEISDTNGAISSIKEEYDENGNLSETTVYITYTDENGVNHRTKVYIDAA